MTRRIRLRLDPEPLAPRVARRALQELADELPPARLADAGLLVSELVTNCVRYAAPSPIDLIVDLASGSLRVEVRDGGPGIPAHGAEAIMPGPTSGRGRGLALVASVAEGWGIGAGPGGCVWFSLDVAAHPPAGAAPQALDVGRRRRP